MEMKPLLLLILRVQELSSHVSFNPHARFIFVVTGYFANINLFLNMVIKVCGTISKFELNVHDSKT
jgi:hypothetical protein